MYSVLRILSEIAVWSLSIFSQLIEGLGSGNHVGIAAQNTLGWSGSTVLTFHDDLNENINAVLSSPAPQTMIF